MVDMDMEELEGGKGGPTVCERCAAKVAGGADGISN